MHQMNSLSYRTKALKLRNVGCQWYLHEVEKEDSWRRRRGRPLECFAEWLPPLRSREPSMTVLGPHVPANTWFRLFRISELWHLVTFWIYSSLMTNQTEHLFMCLRATHISSLVKYLFKCFAHIFFIGSVVFSLLKVFNLEKDSYCAYMQFISRISLFLFILFS